MLVNERCHCSYNKEDLFCLEQNTSHPQYKCAILNLKALSVNDFVEDQMVQYCEGNSNNITCFAENFPNIEKVLLFMLL